jgi:hypothetical protein
MNAPDRLNLTSVSGWSKVTLEGDTDRPPGTGVGYDVSVVVTWEPRLRGGEDRATAMLNQLALQTTSLDRRFQVLFVSDDGEVDLGALRSVVEATQLSTATNVEVEYVPYEGKYFDSKNAGAGRARGDLVAFLDSDLIPEDGWLENLLGALDDPARSIAGGWTYLGPVRSLYDKTFALFWLFPLRGDGGPPIEHVHFYPNNVVFRRELLHRYPYRVDQRHRGSDSTLAARFRAEGVTIWRVPSARAMHPPPIGVRNMIRRALWYGHDHVVAARNDGEPDQLRMMALARLLAGRMKGAALLMATDGPDVGLTRAQMVPALAITGGYFLFWGMGFVITRLAPGFIPRFFPE